MAAAGLAGTLEANVSSTRPGALEPKGRRATEQGQRGQLAEGQGGSAWCLGHRASSLGGGHQDRARASGMCRYGAFVTGVGQQGREGDGRLKLDVFLLLLGRALNMTRDTCALHQIRH